MAQQTHCECPAYMSLQHVITQAAVAEAQCGGKHHDDAIRLSVMLGMLAPQLLTRANAYLTGWTTQQRTIGGRHSN